ncbi:MAG TPA: SDR family oxidoreductase [Candidatus Limnocylindria bacterium]|nr:SDR family oxidoreductase [Candidatus Limnocylindria bacterium]
MKVFVTGSDGYLGSLLTPLLMQNGHEVTGCDTGFYNESSLFNDRLPRPKTLSKDVREINEEDLRGHDAIVHMAELSNDPAGELAPNITYEINHLGSVRLARLAEIAKVPRFVYMSSCSVYGVADSDFVDERSPTNPQTVYAICKTLVERDVRALANDKFSPTFLRNATAYGASPRMRFDIVLNNLCGLAWTTREIKMTSDGTPWRPLVHGLDIAQAILCVLTAPRAMIHSQVLNVGDTQHNWRVRELAEIIAEVFDGCRLSFGAPGADNRSYRVNFDKIHALLPAFACEWNAELGARQLRALFSRIQMTFETFQTRSFTRLTMLEHLLRTGQIDADFFWKPLRMQETDTNIPIAHAA